MSSGPRRPGAAARRSEALPGTVRSALLCLLLLLTPLSRAADDWFETFKHTASDDQLLHFLHAMPKGGDLHDHIGGATFPEWYWEIALADAKHGYHFYTKVRIDNCRYGGNEFGRAPYLLMFRTLAEHDWKQLSDCERKEFLPLEKLSEAQRQGWLSSLKLDKPWEGRQEFFEADWARLDGLLRDPYLVAEIIVRNMRAFGEEGLSYLEAQASFWGFQKPDGTPIDPEQVLAIYRDRLAQQDAIDTGVTVRFQVSVLRFTPNAEQQLRTLYAFAAAHDDVVGVNMVGREDNDKGYPLRFLDTLRDLRRTQGGVHLSIHAGEVDEPNEHVRDTLLLGAERIGHGVNLITDPDTMLLMRKGPWLVEINLISNLLLEYVKDYKEHPFPEYLRTGIPVALSTDDRGMFGSGMTDEFFVAVKEFNLSWAEIRELELNSLKYAFVEEPEKTRLIDALNRRLDNFEKQFRSGGLAAVDTGPPQYRAFLCSHYKVCAP